MSCPPFVRLRIVIIDDDDSYADELARWLRTHRHHVEVPRGLVRGLRLLRRLAPDIVIVDPSAFDRDPVELVRRLDEIAGPGARVVVLAEQLTVAELEAWLEAGAVARLRKTDAVRSLWRFTDRRGLAQHPRLLAL